MLDRVFWIARIGAQWRDLREVFAKWSSVYRRFRRWTLSGLWDLLLEVSNDTEGVGVPVQMIHSTVIRAHHRAADARGAPRQGLGRSRGGLSTRIHLRTNGAGLPVAVDITPGQASDYTGALLLLDAGGPEPKVLLADRGYDADAVRTEMEARRVTPIIPMRRSRKVQIAIGGHIYALRNRIERCFNMSKRRRRPVTRCDKTAECYLGFVLIAAVRPWMREFVDKTAGEFRQPSTQHVVVRPHGLVANGGAEEAGGSTRPPFARLAGDHETSDVAARSPMRRRSRWPRQNLRTSG